MVSSQISEAKRILLSDGVVAIPTETVYGLAASVRSQGALRKIFELKARPLFDPLIVHIFDCSQLKELVSEWPEIARLLAETFWPGPLTLVLPKVKELNSLITAGLDTVGVRMPSHPVARELLKAVGVPLAAPSANQFGKVSPTRSEHVAREFSENLFILEGGQSEVGVESTVVRISNSQIEILRPGLVTSEMIEAVVLKHKVGYKVVRKSSQASPGNLEQHYQPKIPLMIVGESTDASAMARRLKIAGELGVEFQLSGEPLLVARSLYSCLREFSESGVSFIYVRRLPHHRGGAWDAIWDRLQRAASFCESM